jgi:phosphoribosylanthranilate isomerase
MNPIVKICGLTRVEDAALAVSVGADWIGLNFYPGSPRFVDIGRAQEIVSAISRRAKVVGVFVNTPREVIDRVYREVGLDLLQLSGDDEDSSLSGWPIPVIRALRIKPEALPDLRSSRADFVLLDSWDPNRFGGTGHTLILDRLRGIDLSRAIIAGGLRPHNVAAAAALRPYGVDVASGVESAPGIKDCAKMRSFVVNAKSVGP